MVIGGNLPQACGLSSSSSLVVATALAMSSIRLSRQHISPEMLGEICMKAEWHVGTAGGGMDQAAIILSRQGYATNINFHPLRTRLISLPKGITIIVANSMSRSAKAETVHVRFNKRVFECKLGLRILRQSLTTLVGSVDPVTDTFAELLSALGCTSVELLEKIRKNISENLLSKKDIEKAIGSDIVEDLISRGRWGRKVWELNDKFFVLKRAIHVMTESNRVDEFSTAAESNDSIRLCELMNESGISCDIDYDCSCDELRELISDMKASGCQAARLTGAGWGGCAVGLVVDDSEDLPNQVVEKIQQKYYIDRLGMSRDDVVTGGLVFACEPANGAYIE